MKNSYKNIIFYLILIIGIVIAVSVLLGSPKKSSTVYSDLAELFQSEQVKTFEVDGKNMVRIVTQEGQTIEYRLRDFGLFYNDFRDLILEQKEKGIIEAYDYKQIESAPWWLSMLPYLLISGISIFMVFYLIRQTGAGKINSFGKTRAKVTMDDKKKVMFDDVAGADEEKEELKEVVEFLRDPGKYTKLGAKIPHGVLLVGPPGTGKTLLAKAVAGEAGVPFYSISGSDFVEMYVGVGASRVRDLFDTAKKNPAAIIFIDEIDAVGRHRGAGLGGGHDEREQTLNQLLVEMDGFGTGDSVIVMAATNRPDILDPALLRPGRFDRQITVNYPDIKGREAILKVHSKNKPFEASVDLSVIAKTTVGFTGADLANLLNEAALHAARKGKSLIGNEDIEEAMIKVVVGGVQKKSKIISDEDKKITAYHEAGHAVLGKLVQPENTVHQISIIPAGRAAGYTINRPNGDRTHLRSTEMINEIIMTLGGRAAEKIIFGHLTTGASSDIQHATNIARDMVTRYGMCDELGTVVYGSEHGADEVFLGRDFSSGKNFSEETAAKIDNAIRRIVDDAYAKAVSLLEENREKLDLIAMYLFRNETMDEDLFAKAMDEEHTVESLEAVRDEKNRQSKEANEAKKAADEEAHRREEEEQKRREAARQAIDESGFDAYARFQKGSDEGETKDSGEDDDRKDGQ